MTFKELLCNVTFEEVGEHIIRMYPEAKDRLGWYKLHFDMLRLMTPKHQEDDNDDVCRISMKDWEDNTGLNLDAYSMEGDLWEHSLTKKIILASDVQATNAEIAACCLWHTSFYGFTKSQVEESFRANEDLEIDCVERWNDYAYNKARTNKYRRIICRNGGFIPTLKEISTTPKQKFIEKAKKEFQVGSKPINKIKCKRLFRHTFHEAYYEQVAAIGNFIVKVLPALSEEYNYVTAKQLCKLFHSVTFACTSLESYAHDSTDSASYMEDIITKYDMLPPHGDSAIIYLASEHKWDVPPVLNSKEDKLLGAIIDHIVDIDEIDGTVDFILHHNPALGKQVEITVVTADMSIWERNYREQ